MDSKSENAQSGPSGQNGDSLLAKAGSGHTEPSPSVGHKVEIDNFGPPQNGYLPEVGNGRPQQSYNGQPKPLARVSTTVSIENTNGQRSSQESIPEVVKYMNQRGKTFSTKQPESPSSRMTPAVQAKWWKVINTLVRERKVKLFLESFSKSAGSPCERCASMKLTEAKFIISEFSKHVRIVGAVDGHPDLAANDNLGPEGLEFGPHEFKLGALHDLYSRPKCPFCSLATSSLNYQCETFVGHAPDGQERTKDQFYQQDVICFASWQIDGRILIRDKDKRIIGSRACTRRIRLRWTPGSDFSSTLYTTYVVLMAPRNAEKGLFLGRTIDAAKPDAALIQRWLGFCESSHGDKCRAQTRDVSLSKSFFGVIDVKEMCLAKLPDKERYIALSYTWGKNIAPFETKKKGVRALMKYGALRSHLYDIPRTIRDAIKLVTDLGERYLWVDALCIIQDSERSWALNSRVMDVVYGNAYFTICAADGENANAGLRALHNPGPTQTIKQYNRDIRLMCTQPAENFIQHSEWNKRGWTFQERLLSARNLIFTAGRMYFQCRCTARSIDIQSEDESMGWSIEFKDSPLLMLQKLSNRPLSVYKQALGLYMKRELTHSKDILAAFTGIGNLVCGALGGSLVYGLPSSHFDWALLWEPRDAAIRRKDEGSERFPSWSWCGWKDQIMEYKEQRLSGCEDNLRDWLMNHTWITWYIRDGNGNLRLVWNDDCGNMASSKVDSTSRGYCKPEPIDEETHDSYGRFIPPCERKDRRCKDFKQILDECPYDVDFIETIDNQSQNSTEKDMPYLQFYTWAAFFRIQEDRRFSHNASFGKNFRRYSILDYKDDWCGTILLEKFWVRERNLKINLEGHPDRNQEELLEFIAISDAKRFDDEEYNDWANYIPVDRMESTWDLYYVLLVEYKDDIAYRVGLGKVFKEAFENSCKPEGKQWKEFILG